MLERLECPQLSVFQMKNDDVNLQRLRQLKKLSLKEKWHTYNYWKNLSPGLSGAELKILAEELGI